MFKSTTARTSPANRRAWSAPTLRVITAGTAEGGVGVNPELSVQGS